MPRAFVLLISAAAALAPTACGGSSSSSSSSTGSSSAPASTPTQPSGSPSGSSIGADPGGQLKFTKSSLSAKAGKVAIRFTNSAPVPHNLTIQQGTNGAVVGATPTFSGGTKTLSVNLKPGTYTFFCSVPGHRQAGMQGTLTVR